MAILIQSPEELLFIHVPKTGGTSIASWIKENFQFKKSSRIHCSLNQARLEFGKSGASFAVVRDPWDRMVSYYHFIIRATEGRIAEVQKGNVVRPHKLKWNEDYLKNFLHELNKGFDYFLENKNLWDKGALSTQYEIASGTDLILKFENLEKDFEIIQKRLNCFKPLLKLNTTNHTHYKTYYNSNKSIDIIADHFKDDILKYGYSF